MDIYSKLSEAGSCLYSSKQYELSIEVLNLAQKLSTNQKGITMRIQLTLANAHSALRHVDLALSLYQVYIEFYNHMIYYKFNQFSYTMFHSIASPCV